MSISSFTLPLRGVVCGVTGLVAAGITGLLAWQERAAERRQLQSLDDSALRDIGLSRADVESAFSKPFWRV
jgi:uncharacterized protein YjiS (DUF1127 family)